MTGRSPCSPVALEAPKDHPACLALLAPQVTKAPEGFPDSPDRTDYKASRASQETQAAKGPPGPQGSWDPEDPKVPWASLVQKDSRALMACQALQGPLGTGAFPEKCWGHNPGPGATLGCLDTPA